MRIFISAIITKCHRHLFKSNLFLLLLLPSLSSRAQISFAPDDYTVFTDSVFKIKARYKTKGELKGMVYSYKASTSEMHFKMYEARFGMTTNILLKKLQQYKTSAGKKVIYSSTTIYKGYDTSSHTIYDTIFNTRTYAMHKEYDKGNKLISDIKITSAGDTVSVMQYKYDSLGRLTKSSFFLCLQAGYKTTYDSVTGFSNTTRITCTDRRSIADMGDSYSYETDAKNRISLIRKKHPSFNDTKTDEIFVRYSHRGRKQYRIYLYPKPNYHHRVVREKPKNLRIPKSLPFKQSEFTEQITSYGVLRFDSKKRIKSYRYYYNGTVLIIKYRYG